MGWGCRDIDIVANQTELQYKLQNGYTIVPSEQSLGKFGAHPLRLVIQTCTADDLRRPRCAAARVNPRLTGARRRLTLAAPCPLRRAWLAVCPWWPTS